MIPAFLRPERVPTTLTIVRAPATDKLTLSAPEFTACVQILARGKTLRQALEAIRAQRQFLATFPV